MNCDQAFESMTDPDRPHDRQLSDHLRACRRCRQMYETLEPALGLFAAVDGVADESQSVVPTRLASPRVRMAQQIAARLSPAGSRSPGEPPRHRLWGAVFAAVVAGFLLSVGLGSSSWNVPGGVPDAARGCTWLAPSAVPDGETASAVVVTCVTCHLSQTPERTQSKIEVREFSRDLDRLIIAWHAAAAVPRTLLDVLIAECAPRVPPYV
ncbi:MAG: hypothetical protein KF861_06305 [Planctomycetaceae bacterium]|nr:hypothetical protein [Planctomycetaceae bacterium]